MSFEELREEIKQLKQKYDFLQIQFYEAMEEIKQLNQQLNISNEEEEEEDDEVDEEADNEEESKFIPLKGFENDYEIKNYYPYTIRRKSNNKIVKESIDKTNGYFRIHLNDKTFQKHILIAKQFIRNPEKKPYVDHINRNRSDYHVSNLRWVSEKENSRNRTSNKGIEYEFVKSIPINAMKVEKYGNHLFEDYYFFNDVFYFYNGIEYRKLHISETRNGSKYVSVIDTNENKTIIYYSKFKKIHDLK